MPVLRKGMISPEQILNSADKDNILNLTIAQLNAASLYISLNNTRKQDIPVDISANVTKIRHFETEWNRLNGDNIQRLMQQWYDENKYSFIY